MRDKRLPYELSSEADADLESIFDYTLQAFGPDKACTYVESFDDTFENLASNPKLGRTRDEIVEGLRSIVKESHIVFYRILRDRLRIVRILHISRDVNGIIPPSK